MRLNFDSFHCLHRTSSLQGRISSPFRPIMVGRGSLTAYDEIERTAAMITRTFFFGTCLRLERVVIEPGIHINCAIDAVFRKRRRPNDHKATALVNRKGGLSIPAIEVDCLTRGHQPARPWPARLQRLPISEAERSGYSCRRGRL